MAIDDILRPEAIVPSLRASNKKQVLLELSEKAAQLSGLSARADVRCADAARASRLDRHRRRNRHPAWQTCAVRERFSACSRGLERPIAFEALDDAPVDLIFLLLAPEGAGADHLSALSRAARALRDPGTVRMLRATRDASAIYSVLMHVSTPNAA